MLSVRLANERYASLPAVRALYESAFPMNERRPWHLQKQLIQAGHIHCLLLEKKGAFAGFLFFWTLPAFVFIEHIAIQPSLRGSGAGSAMLRWMEEHYSIIVLETEPASNGADALRRIGFYERLGYVPFPENYIQPSYGPGRAPLPMLLMYRSTASLPGFTTISAALYEHVYRVPPPER